jgi:lipopolysaccharide export system protein LptC
MTVQAQATMSAQATQRTPDRAKAFREAQRHSARVRFFRVALPLCVAGIVAFYFVPNQVEVKTNPDTPPTLSPKASHEGSIMTNLHYAGSNNKYGSYRIEAKSAIQNAGQPDFITLNTITGKLVSPARKKTMLRAPSGLYNRKKEELSFNKGLQIRGQDGISVKLKTATADIKKHELVSTDPVDMRYHGSSIYAKGVTIYTNESRVVFTGGVRTHLKFKAKKGE